jgi:hypothetical protein
LSCGVAVNSKTVLLEALLVEKVVSKIDPGLEKAHGLETHL